MRFPDLHKFDRFAYDTETTGLRYKVDRVFGFSISTPDGADYYYDVRETPDAIDKLNSSMRSYRGTIICHNASFDFRMSDHTGIKLPIERLDDTVIRACAINEHLFTYELDYLAKKYLGEEKETDIYHAMSGIFGGLPTRNVQIQRISEAPPEIVGPYAMKDTRLTLDLWDWQDREIERQQIQPICRFERHKMPTFIRAEMRGIRVDEAYAEEAADKLTPIIEEKQSELNKLAGEDINVNSSPQIKKMFNPKEIANGVWTTEKGEAIGTTPKGGPSLKADYLREMSDPRAQLILDIRSIIKTRDTFLRGHVLGHSVDSVVYPTINQSKGEDGGTGTGRLSIQNPAMQQIPSRNKEIAAIVKPCFLPPEGMIWVDADMASFEVRVFAHLIENEQILKQYQDDPTTDFHQFVADLTGLVRNATYSGQPNAKQLNLSMIFNSGRGAIADKMGMPWEWESFLPRGKEDKEENYITYKKPGPEAVQVIEQYHRRVPGVRELADGCKKTAERRGFLFTRTGRRLRFPRGYKSYKASGILIQATAADYNKENWSIIEEQLGDQGHIMLNTHDSYSMAMQEGTWQDDYRRVKAEIEEPGRARVPLLLDLSGAGHNWWDAIRKDNEFKDAI